MKPAIHPEYVEAKVICSCGNTFTTRSTKPELHVELCSQCHPFYTGKQKFVDTGGRVQRFSDKFGNAAQNVRDREAADKEARRVAAEEAAVKAKQEREVKEAAKAEADAKAAKEAEREARKAARAEAAAVAAMEAAAGGGNIGGVETAVLSEEVAEHAAAEDAHEVVDAHDAEEATEVAPEDGTETTEDAE